LLTVGVDLGGTKCLGVVLDGQGRVVDEHRLPTPASSGAGAVVDALVECAGELAGRHAGVSGLGVGVPGLVDSGGTLRYAPNLPGVTELPVAALLQSRFGRDVGVVVVDNDATCAAWAERELGAGRSAEDLVAVTLGTGIGAGIVLGGRLYRGAHGFAGEVGHMVLDPGGPACVCGQRGCWERYASGSGLASLARDAMGDVRGEDVTRAAAAGDAVAAGVVRTFAWWVALGLANLANALDPELFVLGGGLVEAGDVLLAPVRDAFSTLVEAASHRPAVDIVPATLGEHAGAIGAALFARPAP
jgi:glucokinase